MTSGHCWFGLAHPWGKAVLGLTSMPQMIMPGTTSRVLRTIMSSAVFMSKADMPGAASTMPSLARRFTPTHSQLMSVLGGVRDEKLMGGGTGRGVDPPSGVDTCQRWRSSQEA